MATSSSINSFEKAKVASNDGPSGQVGLSKAYLVLLYFKFSLFSFLYFKGVLFKNFNLKKFR
jgi:hypothetical protein